MSQKTSNVNGDSEAYDPDAGEEHLAELIHEAGEDVRAKNRAAMEQHFERIRRIVEEAVSRWKDAGNTVPDHREVQYGR
ncbi:MAG: hypothetical protein WEB58_18340 [Planctomycetaceae bacterium]